MNKGVFIYRMDRTDTIVSISDNWCTFANANDWGGSLRPEDVVGRKLWDFIQDLETQHLYQELLNVGRHPSRRGLRAKRKNVPALVQNRRQLSGERQIIVV